MRSASERASGEANGESPPGATSDAYPRAVTLGERRPHGDTIHLAPDDPQWPARFESLAARIRAAPGGRALLLEHVGSTAVPALAAKPVIDIVLAVADSADEASYVPALQAQGFVLRIREPGWFEHRLLRAPEFDRNLHVFSAGCEEIRRMLAFRDRLRAHAGERAWYETTKRHLAARAWKHVQRHADAKSEVVRGILARADAAAQQRRKGCAGTCSAMAMRSPARL